MCAILQCVVNNFAKLLKKTRSEKYRSARQFGQQVDLKISYPQYSRYESGEQLPSLDQAVLIMERLEIPLMQGILIWCQSQAKENASVIALERLIDQSTGVAPAAGPGQVARTAPQANVNLDEVIVFNRSHLKVFESDPSYRDVFTFISAYYPDWISEGELAAALGISREKVAKRVADLADLGVIRAKGTGKHERQQWTAAKSTFYFPDDEEFFGLRNQNLRHNMDNLLGKLKHEDIVAKRAMRGVVTRELSAEQVGLVIEGVERLMMRTVQMQAVPSASTGIYSLCFLLGERFSRSASIDEN
ncbi:MAG: helix-turn-helix domain-containing protein [Bacteriovoracia bacterium]